MLFKGELAFILGGRNSGILLYCVIIIIIRISKWYLSSPLWQSAQCDQKLPACGIYGSSFYHSTKELTRLILVLAVANFQRGVFSWWLTWNNIYKMTGTAKNRNLPIQTVYIPPALLAASYVPTCKYSHPSL